MSERCRVAHRIDELEYAGCAACAWRAYHDAVGAHEATFAQLELVTARAIAAEDALAAAREDTKMLDHLDTLASGITINGDRDFPSMSMTPKEPGFSHTRRLIEMDMLRRAAVPPGETPRE